MSDDVKNNNEENISAKELWGEDLEVSIETNEPVKEEAVVESEPVETEEKPVIEAVSEEPKVDKTVPLGALHEERARRKQAQEELKRHKAELDAAKERLNKFEQALQEYNNKRTQEQVPSYDDDPIGHVKYQQDQLLKKQQQEEVTRQQQKEQEVNSQRNTEHLKSFLDDYQTAFNESREEIPDLTEAYNFLIKAEIDDAIAAGEDQQTALQLTHQKEINIAYKAIKQGKSVGKIIYDLAARRGYRQAETRAKPDTNQDLEKMKQLKAGLSASKTMSGASSPTKDTTSIDDLINKIESGDPDADDFWDKFSRGKL